MLRLEGEKETECRKSQIRKPEAHAVQRRDKAGFARKAKKATVVADDMRAADLGAIWELGHIESADLGDIAEAAFALFVKFM